jgi:hypothetical protein
MDNAELRQLALDIVDGRVVGTWSMRDNPDQVGTSFPLIHMLDNEQFKQVKDSAHIYEYRDKALSMGVNGRPMFMSFRILSLEDWEPLRHMLDELYRQRQTFLSPEPETC